MILNFIISNFLLKIGYFIFTPKNYSFGAYYGAFINGIKIAKYLKKKKIVCLSFIDYHNKFSQKKIYNISLSLKIISKLKLDEIILSFLFTILLFPFQLIYYLKITSIINKVLGKKFSFKLIPNSFGYTETFTDEKLENKYNFGYQLKLDPKLFSKTKVNIFEKKRGIENRLIAFCVKDENYNKFKQISEVFCSDIEQTREALNYLIENGFQINRIGEPLMKNFDFINENYKDFTQSINHLNQFNLNLEKCNFYFGSGASQGEAVEFFDKRKLIINSVDHMKSSFSYKKKNVMLFKKIYDVKRKKILSIEELFNSDLFDHFQVTKKSRNKEIILIENNKDEIIDSVKFFLDIDKDNYSLDKINKQYFDIRKLAIQKKVKNKFCSFYLACEFNEYSLSSTFLNQHLFNNKYLDEISKRFRHENLKN